jgi:hypothetical protein
VGATYGPLGIIILDHEYTLVLQIHHEESKFHAECHGVHVRRKTVLDI